MISKYRISNTEYSYIFSKQLILDLLLLVCVIVFKLCPVIFNPLSLLSFLEIICNHTCLVVDKTYDTNLKVRSDLFVLVDQVEHTNPLDKLS